MQTIYSYDIVWRNDKCIVPCGGIRDRFEIGNNTARYIVAIQGRLDHLGEKLCINTQTHTDTHAIHLLRKGYKPLKNNTQQNQPQPRQYTKKIVTFWAQQNVCCNCCISNIVTIPVLSVTAQQLNFADI